MTSGAGSAREAVRILRERYRAGSGAIVQMFMALSSQLSKTPDAPDAIEAVRREAHRVHGTAGTYGFDEASEIAAGLERRCIEWAKDASVDASARAAIVERAANALAAAFAVGPPDRTPGPSGSAGEPAAGA